MTQPPDKSAGTFGVQAPLGTVMSVGEAIAREISSWEGVSSAPHRFGGVEFRLGKRELGHLHGSRLADLPFPRRVRDDLVSAGRAVPHHVMPESGWVSFWVGGANDVEHVL